MITLTHHAVEQYISRFDRTLTPAEAWEKLEAQIPYADRMKQRSLKGDTLWRLPGGAYLVTKQGASGEPVAVTVLRDVVEQDRNGFLPTEEELEMLLERGATEPVPEYRMEGSMRLRVDVDYVLGIQNGPVVRERIIRALGRMLAGFRTTPIAHGTITKYSVTEAEDT